MDLLDHTGINIEYAQTISASVQNMHRTVAVRETVMMMARARACVRTRACALGVRWGYV